MVLRHEKKKQRVWTDGDVVRHLFREQVSNISEIEYTYIVFPCVKISNEVGRSNNCRALARQLSVLPTSLDIVDISFNV